MGEVWLAWDGSLRRNVALKLLRTNGSATAESVRRFEREARGASLLDHPNISTIHDIGETDDEQTFIAMAAASPSCRLL